MRFMNDWDIDRAAHRAQRNDQPVKREAARQLAILRDWANANSDGWAYWPKPARAAARLMELVEGDGTYASLTGPDATPAQLRAALAPVKAFRTRQGADFPIVDIPQA